MKNKFLLVILFIIIGSVFMVGCSQFLEKIGFVPPNSEEERVGDKAPPGQGMVRVIIGFEKPPQAAEQALIKGAGGKIKTTYRMIPAIAAQVPEKAIEALKKNPNVTEIEMDTKVYAYEVNSNWGIEAIGADIAHANNFLGDGIEVAVIDTGIDYWHGELSSIYAGGYNFVNLDNDPADDNGHGTHVAGIIAANNQAIGVAPNVALYALKALDAEGMGYISDIISAIQWASDPNGNGLADDRLDIINMSFGAPIGNIFLRLACHLAYRDGLLLVAAAGNEGGGSVGYPAAYDRVVAVSATDVYSQIASFSSTGPEVELAAPGVEIYSTLPDYSCTLSGEYGNGYGILSGTSMACPHVVGAAALVWGANSGWSNEQVRSQLTSTAQDIGLSSNEQGYGLVDVAAALGLDEEADTTPPAQVTGLTAIAVSSSQIGLSWVANTEDDLNHYNIFRDNSLIESSTATSYSDTGLTPSTSYCYQVSAVDTSGNEGTLSDQTCDTAEDETPSYCTVTFITGANGILIGETTFSDILTGTPWNEAVTVPTPEPNPGYQFDAWTPSFPTTVMESATYTANFIEDSVADDEIHVQDIAFAKKGVNLFITVTVFDGNNQPLSNVEVDMKLEFDSSSTLWNFNGTTDSEGKVTFRLKKPQSGEYTATVTDLILSGYFWDKENDPNKTATYSF